MCRGGEGNHRGNKKHSMRGKEQAEEKKGKGYETERGRGVRLVA